MASYTTIGLSSCRHSLVPGPFNFNFNTHFFRVFLSRAAAARRLSVLSDRYNTKQVTESAHTIQSLYERFMRLLGLHDTVWKAAKDNDVVSILVRHNVIMPWHAVHHNNNVKTIVVYSG